MYARNKTGGRGFTIRYSVAPKLMNTSKTKKLTQRLADNQQAREKAAVQSKWLMERVKMITDAPPRTLMDFWCMQCQQDFSCTDALKMAGMSQGLPRGYYEGACPEGHVAIRHITDKHMDPYYHQSVHLRVERHRMADDVLTPEHPRFRTLYPKQYERIMAERDAIKEQEQLYG